MRACEPSHTASRFVCRVRSCVGYHRAVKVAVVAALAASSSPSVVPDAGDNEAGDNDASSGRCDPTKPFDASQPVWQFLGMGLDVSYGHSWLSADELTIYFARIDRSSSGGTGTFTASRTDLDAPWGAVWRVADLVENLTLTSDQLTMYASQRGAAGIMVATRVSLSEPFDTFTAVPELSMATAPNLLSDQTTLYATSGDQVQRWTKVNGVFAQPTPVNGVEGGAVISDDELTAYFSFAPSNYIPDRATWTATRASRTEDFTDRVAVAPIGSSPSWVSLDGCALYQIFNSDPRHGTGSISIFLARKPP